MTALLCAVSYCHSADGLLTHNLSYRRFTTLDGLSQMQTEKVWQDSRGYIYIGTLSGFVRYDGLTLTPFLRGQRENIVGFQEIGGQVRAMGFVRQWSISGDNVTKEPIDPEGNFLLNNFNAADLPTGYVLLEDRQEQNRRLCQMTETGMKRVMTSPLLDEMTPDRKMYLDSTLLYVPTLQGGYRLQEGHVAVKITDKTDIFSFIRTADGLLALAADGLYRVDRDGISLLSEHPFDAPDYGLVVRQNRQRQLIVADSHTIWIYDAGLWRQLATGFNMIKDLFIDKWNRLWAATYQGAYCFFHCNFVNHRLTDENDIVRAIAFNDGRMVMGTLNGKVIADGRLLVEDKDNYFAPSTAVIDGKVYMAGNGDVAEISGNSVEWLRLPYDKYQFVSRYQDRLIIGTRSCVLSYNTTTRYLDTLTTETVRPWCAADDGQGSLWVGCTPGLCRLSGINDGKLSIEHVKSTPTTLVVTTMATDGRGHICFALGDSLFAIHNGDIRAMTEALPTLKGHEIRSVHISTRGYLVVAAIDGLMVTKIPTDLPIQAGEKLTARLSDGQSWIKEKYGFFHDSAVTFCSDLFGYDLSLFPEELVKLSRNSFDADAEKTLSLKYDGSGGLGYNTSMITQNALLLDRSDEADRLVRRLTRMSYAPRLPEPYKVSEGFSYSQRTGALRRQGDLGNLVHLAEALKAYQIVCGVSDAAPGTLQIFPRLPKGWSVDIHGMRAAGGTLCMSASYPENGVQKIDLKVAGMRGIKKIAFRGGPFKDGGKLIINGKEVRGETETHGRMTWIRADFPYEEFEI